MDRLEELRQQIENVENLTLDELRELDTEIVSVFDAIVAGEVDGVAKDDIDVLKELGAATQDVRTRAETLQAEIETREAAIAELANVVHAEAEETETEEDEDESDEDVEEETEDEVEAEASEETEVVAETTEAPEAQVEEATSEEKKVLPALAAAAKRRKGAHMAGANVTKMKSREVTFTGLNGEELSMAQVANMIVDKRRQFGTIAPGVSERISVAQLSQQIPDDRFLNKTDSIESINEKVNAVIADAMTPMSWQDDALIASGGFCAPLDSRYDIEVVAGAHRPVRDSLPRFGADRGGLRFRGGISLASARALGATEVWSAATDESPGGATKNVGTITCPTITEVELDAVTRILEIGNLMSRADQEAVQAWINAVNAAWAEEAEKNLLDGIDASSTAVSTDQHLGLARDFLEQVARAASAYRWRNRLMRDARLRIMAPAWLPDALSSDLVRGTQSDPGFLEVSAEDINRYLAKRNINVSWYADNPTGATGTFSQTQGAHDLLGWPSTFRWYMFHEGAFLMLDGGVLDLGVVRDSTLNGTNDYQLFAESFENVAFIGVESLRVTTNLCVSGMSAGTDDLTTQCVS